MLKHSLSKEQRYQELVEKFKNYEFPEGLSNPHTIKDCPFNYNVINPWELWHGCIDNPKIMLIGQDFADVNHFKDTLKNNWKNEKECYTNKTLGELFEILGYKIEMPDPSIKRNEPLYFTNAVLGLKDGTMNAPIKKDGWYKCTANDYLAKIIEIIKPKYIICMSVKAYETVCFIQGIIRSDFKSAIEQNGNHPKLLGANLFIVAHCSRRGQSNRGGFLKQKEDWLKIKEYIEKNK